MHENKQHNTLIKYEKRGLRNEDLLVFESLPSTNAWVLENIDTLKDGNVVRAINQTAGRGRFNRIWTAPEGCNLNLSAIINHTKSEIPITMLLPATAIAIRNALKEFKIEATLKWPNDVMVNNKKIAGILAEVEPATNLLIIGIGLNVNIDSHCLDTMNFPQAATSMMAEQKHSFDLDAVCSKIISTLEETVNALYKNGVPYIAQEWTKSDHLSGKLLSVNSGTSIITGLYAGMQESGQLKITDSTGKEHLFWSGDVTLQKNSERDSEFV